MSFPECSEFGEGASGEVMYFCLFVLLSTMILLNLVIGVITQSMDQVRKINSMYQLTGEISLTGREGGAFVLGAYCPYILPHPYYPRVATGSNSRHHLLCRCLRVVADAALVSRIPPDLLDSLSAQIETAPSEVGEERGICAAPEGLWVTGWQGGHGVTGGSWTIAVSRSEPV